MTNEEAIKIQKRIIELSNKYMSMKEEDEYERLNERFSLEMSTLPKEAKRLDERGYLIYWEVRK